MGKHWNVIIYTGRNTVCIRTKKGFHSAGVKHGQARYAVSVCNPAVGSGGRRFSASLRSAWSLEHAIRLQNDDFKTSWSHKNEVEIKGDRPSGLDQARDYEVDPRLETCEINKGREIYLQQHVNTNCLPKHCTAKIYDVTVKRSTIRQRGQSLPRVKCCV